MGGEDSDFGVESVLHGGTAFVHVRGSVDASTANDFLQDLRVLIEKGAHELVVVLADVTFIDSAGLWALVLAQRQLVSRRLVVARAQGQVRRAFELSGLEHVFTMEDY